MSSVICSFLLADYMVGHDFYPVVNCMNMSSLKVPNLAGLLGGNKIACTCK